MKIGVYVNNMRNDMSIIF